MTSGFHLPPITSRVASIGQLYLYFFGVVSISIKSCQYVTYMFVPHIYTVCFQCILLSHLRMKYMKKVSALSAYFSHSGNTRVVAHQIHERVGGDIFEIVPVDPYPRDYDAVVDQARKELDQDYRPRLKKTIGNMGSYNVIFVGYPNWWGTIPDAGCYVSDGIRFFRKNHCTVLHARGKRSGSKRHGYQGTVPTVNCPRWSCRQGQRCKKCTG